MNNDSLKFNIKKQQSAENSNQTSTWKINSKNENNKVVTKYFYKIANHHELFKTGYSFYKDYKNGIKNFAITSTGFKNAQQRTILGIASYFAHEEDLSIAIISDNLEHNCFREMYEMATICEAEIGGCSNKLIFNKFQNHFDFYNVNNILKFAGRSQITKEFEIVINTVIENYDAIFWDVPNLMAIKNSLNVFQTIISKFESLSIVVNKQESNAKDINEIKSFYIDYGIKLKGLIMDKRS